MPGKLVHFELPSHDTARAREFWGGLFGWQFRDPGIPGLQYWLTQISDDQGGAVMESDGSERGLIVYFDTEDIDDSIQQVHDLGGESEEKVPIPHVGWFARCTDTEGNEFSLFQSDETVGA